MARIDIVRDHPLTQARARVLMKAFAEELANQYGAQYAFEGDRLVFQKGGASGTVELPPGQIHIQGELGFLMSPLKGTMERHIHAFLDDLISKEVAKTTAKKTARKTTKTRG